MRLLKRPKASKPGLEAHYVSSVRPATGAGIANLGPTVGHWVIRPANSRTTTRVWRFR
jgi:hypothetical protein